jgi:hypothetical protein
MKAYLASAAPLTVALCRFLSTLWGVREGPAESYTCSSARNSMAPQYGELHPQRGYHWRRRTHDGSS